MATLGDVRPPLDDVMVITEGAGFTPDLWKV
jgi:hypothetical protein